MNLENINLVNLQHCVNHLCVDQLTLCICVHDYYGMDRSMNSSEYLIRKDLRNKLVENWRNVIVNDDSTAESISSWISMCLVLSQKSEEVDNTIVKSALNMLAKINYNFLNK